MRTTKALFVLASIVVIGLVARRLFSTAPPADADDASEV